MLCSACDARGLGKELLPLHSPTNGSARQNWGSCVVEPGQALRFLSWPEAEAAGLVAGPCPLAGRLPRALGSGCHRTAGEKAHALCQAPPLCPRKQWLARSPQRPPEGRDLPCPSRSCNLPPLSLESGEPRASRGLPSPGWSPWTGSSSLGAEILSPGALPVRD